MNRLIETRRNKVVNARNRVQEGFHWARNRAEIKLPVGDQRGRRQLRLGRAKRNVRSRLIESFLVAEGGGNSRGSRCLPTSVNRSTATMFYRRRGAVTFVTLALARLFVCRRPVCPASIFMFPGNFIYSTEKFVRSLDYLRPGRDKIIR